MSDAEHPNAELHEHITELTEIVGILRSRNDATLRSEQIVAKMIVDLERLSVAKMRILEEAKTQLTGIRSDGSPI